MTWERKIGSKIVSEVRQRQNAKKREEKEWNKGGDVKLHEQ